MRGDRWGRVSFAMAAALLLVMAAYSAGYVVLLDRESSNRERASSELQRMEVAIERQALEIDLEAQLMAMELLGTSNSPEEDFTDSFKAYLMDRYPPSGRLVGRYSLFINGSQIELSRFEKRSIDLLPSNSSREVDVDANESSTVAHVPDTFLIDEYGPRNLPRSYQVIGNLTMTITGTDTELVLTKEIDIFQEVETILPFLKNRFQVLDSKCTGKYNELARIVKYILTTVAQFRALTGESTSASVLSQGDVELATNLALALETARYLRVADSDTYSALDGRRDALYGTGNSLSDLVSTYLDEGSIDPADLFMLYTSMDDEPLDIAAILSQSIYALMDQLALKYIDYLGVPSDYTSRIQGAFVDVVNKFLSWIGIEGRFSTSENGMLTIDPGTIELDDVIRSEGGPLEEEFVNIQDFVYVQTGWGDYWYQQGGAWWCGDPATGYYNGSTDRYFMSSESLYPRYRSVYDDETVLSGDREFFYNYREAHVSFDYAASFADDGDYCRFGVENISEEDGLWYFNNRTRFDNRSTSSYYSYDLTPYLGNNIAFGFNFQSDEIGNDTGFCFKDVNILDYYKGTWVDDTPLSEGADVGQYQQNLTWGIQQHLDMKPIDFLDAVVGSAQDALRCVFKKLADNISTLLVKTLFSDRSYPTLTIKPDDKRTVIDDAVGEVSSWVHDGIINLTEEIRNGYLTEEITNQTMQYLHDALSLVLCPLIETLTELINGVQAWVNVSIGAVEDIVDGVGGLINEVAYNSFKWLGLGKEYSDLSAALEGFIDDVWDQVNTLVNNALNEIQTFIESIQYWIENMALDSLGWVFSRICPLIEDAACDVLTLVEGFLVFTMSRLIDGNDVASTKILLSSKYVPKASISAPFEFWGNEQPMSGNYSDPELKRFYYAQEPTYLPSVKSTSPDLARPESTDGYLLVHIGPPQGCHYTNPRNASDRPFETTWNVTVAGSAMVYMEGLERSLLRDGVECPATVEERLTINFTVEITVCSGWALDGIDYTASESLLGDITAFLNGVWDKLTSGVGMAIDSFVKLVQFLVELPDSIASFQSAIVQMLSDAMQIVIDAVKRYAEKAVKNLVENDFMRGLLEAFYDAVGGQPIELTLFGITLAIIVDTSALGEEGGDILFVGTSGKLWDTGLAFNFTIGKGFNDTGGVEYYVLVEGDILLKECDIHFTLDPVMSRSVHILQLHARAESWGLDITCPDVTEYKELSYTIGDVLGWTPTIPIPPLGLNAEIDAGLNIKYTPPATTGVVINEFEQKPASGRQWFELYAPDGVDNIDGTWQVSSQSDIHDRRDVSGLKTLKSGTNYIVYELPDGFLATGDPDDPRQPGDGLVLWAGGEVLDKTPMLIDMGSGGQLSYTHQRDMDGGQDWTLAQDTKGYANSEEDPPFDFVGLIVGIIWDSFQETWEEFRERLELSLDFVADFVKSLVDRIIQRFIDLVESVVKEASLFLDVCLSAATGGPGGGFRLSFVIDGQGLAIFLEWLVNTISTFFQNLLSPQSAKGYPKLPGHIRDHIYIAIEVYVGVDTPAFLEKVATDLDDSVELVVSVRLNVPAITNLFKKGSGKRDFLFGVYIARLESKTLKSLGTSGRKDWYADLWLFKLHAYDL